MTRLTSTDRDGAVKILSILTGGVTATAQRSLRERFLASAAFFLSSSEVALAELNV